MTLAFFEGMLISHHFAGQGFKYKDYQLVLKTCSEEIKLYCIVLYPKKVKSVSPNGLTFLDLFTYMIELTSGCFKDDSQLLPCQILAQYLSR